jgi:putative ABC transport system permease protein
MSMSSGPSTCARRWVVSGAARRGEDGVLRVVRGELLHRRSRTVALLAGIFVATTSFTVLTGTSQTQRLDVRGTVAKSFRGDYDVLVRPRGSRSAFERRTGQVQPNFLSGIFGGISLAQWRVIRAVPGVEVAAPIANIGYVLATARVRVDVSGAVGPRGRVLLRVRIRWRTDRGLSHVPDRASYLYITPNRLTQGPGIDTPGLSSYEGDALREHVRGRSKPVLVCSTVFYADEIDIAGPFSAANRTQVACFSRATRAGRIGYGFFRRGRPAIALLWTFPMLLSAIDPHEEARLTGLDRAIVNGRYLRPADRPRLSEPLRDRAGDVTVVPRLPVLVASRPLLDEQAELAVERLPQASADAMLRRHWFEHDSLAIKHFLERQPRGPVVARRRIGAADAYADLRRQLLTPRRPVLEYGDLYGDQFWRIGPTSYRRTGETLTALSHSRDDRVWAPSANWTVPAAAQDRWFRELRTVNDAFYGAPRPQDEVPTLTNVGVFDPSRLRTARGPGSAPATIYQPPALTARDQRSARVLGGGTLAPNGNIAGYLAQPPSLLTTLRGARVYTSERFPSEEGKPPISAIRVRVAGVTGVDAVSRERIRQAAERIATRTGLDVDITAGASGAPTAIDLPAGRYGRPALALTEPWVRKGVAARVLSAVDRKSVVLFVLILVVCALFVTNATSAAVRARRSELGVLASLGWSTGRLFAVVLGEVGAIGVVAGIAGALLAPPLATLVGVDASPARAALAVPAAIVLALLAGLVPALRAARADPVAAVRPAVLEAHRAWRPRSVGQLALINLLRTPGRTALGALSLAIGICALTLLLAATIAFNNVLVGTLLGDAVAVRVRGTDYVAVIAMVMLGTAAVADVLFLNVRERATEFATLTASGWDDRALGRLVALEGLWIGALGALFGAGMGLAGAVAFAGALPGRLLLTTAAAAASGAVLAAAGALVPAASLRRLPAVELLAEE